MATTIINVDLVKRELEREFRLEEYRARLDALDNEFDIAGYRARLEMLEWMIKHGGEQVQAYGPAAPSKPASARPGPIPQSARLFVLDVLSDLPETFNRETVVDAIDEKYPGSGSAIKASTFRAALNGMAQDGTLIIDTPGGPKPDQLTIYRRGQKAVEAVDNDLKLAG